MYNLTEDGLQKKEEVESFFRDAFCARSATMVRERFRVPECAVRMERERGGQMEIFYVARVWPEVEDGN